MEALAWRNIGRANLMRQRSDSIIFYYQRAIGLAEETGEQEVLKDLQREFQFVCSKHALLQGDTRLWLHYLDMLDTSDASCLLVGTLLARQSANNEEAEARLLKAADSKDLYIKANAYRALYDYSKKIGDGEKTALYSDLYIQYADSLEKKYSLSLSLHELGENYEKQRMEAENERLKNRQLKRTMYWASVVVFLCMILLFGIQYYHKEKRKRKREMARLMKQIREKEHLIEDLRKHQYENEKREGVFLKCEDVLPKRYTAFDSLYKLKVQPYYNMIEAEDEWLEVYAIINLLYGDIVGKLERYPQLSMLDVRTCYLVHARLSNTDIAALFNIDSRSVSKAKQRIKKKMEIDSELSLEDLPHRLPPDLRRNGTFHQTGWFFDSLQHSYKCFRHTPHRWCKLRFRGIGKSLPFPFRNRSPRSHHFRRSAHCLVIVPEPHTGSAHRDSDIRRHEYHPAREF